MLLDVETAKLDIIATVMKLLLIKTNALLGTTVQSVHTGPK
jgi:hypothetical protein